MTDTIQFCEERAASYGAVRKSALTAIALDHAIDRMKSDATTIEALQAQVAARDAALEDACQSLAVAIYGLPEMLEQNALSDEEGMVPALEAAVVRIRAALGQGEG